MEKLKLILIFLLAGLLPAQKVSAQADEIAQLILNIEKLAQFKQILKDMKKGYEILNGGYNTVKNISERNFNLHKEFLDGLLQVSPAVKNYSRVGQIISYQVRIVEQSRAGFDLFRQDRNISQSELDHIQRIYTNVLNESRRNLDELTAVMTAGHLRMSDDERLHSIDQIYERMEARARHLQVFNDGTRMLAIQRAKERKDVETMRRLYGINQKSYGKD